MMRVCAKQDLPINNIEELMLTGMPYTSVTYGLAIERTIRFNEDKLYRDYWENRRVVQYEEFPFDRVRQKSREHLNSRTSYEISSTI